MATRTDAAVSLESGDHLTREEFHRRYCGRPDIKKAELVEGVVYVASPIRVELHARPRARHSLAGSGRGQDSRGSARRQRDGPPRRPERGPARRLPVARGAGWAAG